MSLGRIIRQAVSAFARSSRRRTVRRRPVAGPVHRTRSPEAQAVKSAVRFAKKKL